MIWESSSECNASGFGRGKAAFETQREEKEGRNGANLDNLQTLKGKKERRLG